MTAVISAARVWEHQYLLFRRFWRTSLMAAVLQPLLYLVGIGVGVGTLVDRNGTSSGAELLDGVSYLAFVAPGLIAAAAMTVGVQDSLWPLMNGFKWSNSYRAMVATPLTPGEVAGGIALWQTTKATITSVGVAAVLLLFADTRTPGLVLATLAGIATGLAFALPVTAWSSTRERDLSFPVILRFGVVPMFLFGGIFYPITQLPGFLQPVARATPLWNGVELCRGAVLGGLGAGRAMVHLAVLAGYIIVGYLAARAAFARRLVF
jgi:lipooligosaccharide transport system permease protein